MTPHDIQVLNHMGSYVGNVNFLCNILDVWLQITSQIICGFLHCLQLS